MARVRKRRQEKQSAQETQVVNAARKERSTVIEQEPEQRDSVIHKFETEPAYVRVQAGVTKSLGANTYEFLRLDVSISMPCYKEEVDQTFEEVAERVSVLLDQEVVNYLGAEDGESS